MTFTGDLLDEFGLYQIRMPNTVDVQPDPYESYWEMIDKDGRKIGYVLHGLTHYSVTFVEGEEERDLAECEIEAQRERYMDAWINDLSSE